MLILDFFKWWYEKGLIDFLSRIKTSIMVVFDFFSIDILLKTFFHPFKLIDNEAHGNDFMSQIRASIDRLFSCIFGAVIRFFTILFGLIVLSLYILITFVFCILWLITPILPLLCVILFIFGVEIW